MTKETEPPYHLTIEQLASAAIETLIRDGQHAPTLVAEGTGGIVVVGFEDFGKSSSDNQEQVLRAGFYLAKQPEFGMLRQAFFISEAWMSVAPKDGPLTVPPSQDPDRQEVLIVSGLNVTNHQASLALYELLRNQGGRITQVKALESPAHPVASVESPLLEALLFGFANGRSSNEHEQ